MTDKPLTGRTVATIAVSAFGVIIAVNLFMASQAIGSGPPPAASRARVGRWASVTVRASQGGYDRILASRRARRP